MNSPLDLNCPCCEGENVRVFHRTQGVPVNSVLQLPTREEALNFPTGEIALGHCKDCGFIYNAAFDEKLSEYSERYNPTQAFSETFNKWHAALADELIERYGLKNKKLIEIGCGKGEFLKLLCDRGANQGIGFDPSYEENDETRSSDIEYVTDFYGEKYADRQGDFVCCKMTLEHIKPASDFMGTVRRSVGEKKDTVVFFQVPDMLRILEEQAFWDVYYEHCSYYTMGSLARLFRGSGFQVRALAREYDNQYLMVEARPTTKEEPGTPLAEESDLAEVAALVEKFEDNLNKTVKLWKDRVKSTKKNGEKTVIWGSGSKGVSFLTTLGLSEDIEYVVDINPNRHGHFMAGTGQEIVSPEFLKEYQPQTVIVMNPVYRDEIVAKLDELGLKPEVLTT